MFSKISEKLLRDRMLARVDSKLDKREGSIVWDGVAPTAMELMNLYLALQGVLSESFADTASREYLIKRAKERGLAPEEATYAVVKGKFTPDTVEVPIGSRFTCEGYVYVVTEKIEAGIYKLQCETIGREPNSVTGRLMSIDYVNGLQTAEILEVITLGEEEEDTELFRARYFETLATQRFGGNEIDYLHWLRAIDGVGAVKVHSAAEWNGGGTVLAVILDSEMGIPSDELVDEVQTAVDPTQNQGEGKGFAPIGHFVTVIPAYETKIDVEAIFTFESGYTFESCKDDIEAMLKQYYAELNKSWEHQENGVIVRQSQIEARMLDVKGVIDIHATKIKKSTDSQYVDGNIKLHVDSIVAGGTVSCVE